MSEPASRVRSSLLHHLPVRDLSSAAASQPAAAMAHTARRPSLVVMKFGGTSVQDAAAIQRTLAIVKGRYDRGLRPIVVVSAMAGVTDELLAAATAAAQGRVEESLNISGRLRARHLETAEALVGRGIAELARMLGGTFDRLNDILRGVAAVGELTERTNDLVASFGEQLSSRIVADAFEHRGLRSAHVDARTCIITDDRHGKATPLPEAIKVRLLEHVLPLTEIRAIPILDGFIGTSRHGAPTTLGRGGSDYTAALVGGALQAGAIEIWTDVNGIMTTDPRLCPDALRVRIISFEEASELAYFGAKVLHPATILPAMRQDIPVWVLNSHNPSNEGTVIMPVAPPCSSPLKSIAAKRHLTIVHLVSSRRLLSHGFLRAVFEVFDQFECAIDMVSTSETSVSVTVDANTRVEAMREALDGIADMTVEKDRALICLVGEDIRGQRGIAARVFATVRHSNLQMISQGANGINLSFMVDDAAAPGAVRALHSEFFRDVDAEIFDTSAVHVSADGPLESLGCVAL